MQDVFDVNMQPSPIQTLGGPLKANYLRIDACGSCRSESSGAKCRPDRSTCISVQDWRTLNKYLVPIKAMLPGNVYIGVTSNTEEQPPVWHSRLHSTMTDIKPTAFLHRPLKVVVIGAGWVDPNRQLQISHTKQIRSGFLESRSLMKSHRAFLIST
jgi:hypothetical protein